MENFKVIPEKKYTIQIGNVSLPGFVLESEWNGFSKFANDKKDFVICMRESQVNNMFDSLNLTPSSEVGKGWTPVAGSSKILAYIQEASKKEKPEELSCTTKINMVIEEIVGKVIEKGSYEFVWFDEEVEKLNKAASLENFAKLILSHKIATDFGEK